MEFNIMVIGTKITKDKELEFSYGLQDLFIKEDLKMGKLMELDD